MRTILTVKQQREFLEVNYHLTTIKHKWSTRGTGSSRITDKNDNVLSRAGGCGYDRYGKAVGDFITAIFQDEITKLARRFCKVKNNGVRKSSNEFYGLFLRDGVGYLDGACGYNCIYKVLNCIGFELVSVGSEGNTELFTLQPVSTHNKKYIVERV